jgi:murein L,D-transpeptidase YcbB/YkuD
MKKLLSLSILFLALLALFVCSPTLAATKKKVVKSTYNPVAVAKAKNIWWKNYQKLPKSTTEAMEEKEEAREKAKLAAVGIIDSSTLAESTSSVQPTDNTTTTDVITTTSTDASTIVDWSTFKFSQALKIGSIGDEVSALQQKLKDEGVYNGPVTGNFGKLTAAALKKFQKKHNLTQTGAIGPRTMAALNQ